MRVPQKTYNIICTVIITTIDSTEVRRCLICHMGYGWYGSARAIR